MKKLNSVMTLLITVSYLVFSSGCSMPTDNASGSGKLKIITTLFPQYDFAREIAKDKADIVLLLPPGMESHAYEPSPQDIVNIKKSNVFIYTGEFMEPWAHKLIESTKDNKLVVIDTSNGISLMDEGHHDEEHHDEEHHEEEHHEEENQEEHHVHGAKDPHIWLDPVYAQKMVDNIVEGLSKADPQNESFYKENGESYKKKLQALDAKFSEAFKKTSLKTIMYGGHFAFGYFAKRYGLKHISPYSGFAPDAEPTPQRIAELINNIKESGVKVIYFEELIDPKVAKIISDQTGATMLLLHGAHNISKQELSSGITYISIMEENLEKLKQGLGYNE